MNRKWLILGLLALALVAVGILVAGPGQRPTIQTIGPELLNPNFEDGFTQREAGEVVVAIGWDFAYLQGDDRHCRAPCNRPEYKPEAQDRYVTSGEWSQRWFSTFSRHFGTIHQQVDAVPGAWYEFSCDVYAISTDNQGDLGVFVGLQPWGSGVFDRQMVWGREQVAPGGGWVYDKWTRVSVTAQAFGDRVRVAVGSNPRWAVRGNTVYVDTCAIRRVDELEPQPTPTTGPGGQDCPSLEEIEGAMRRQLDSTQLGPK